MEMIENFIYNYEKELYESDTETLELEDDNGKYKIVIKNKETGEVYKKGFQATSWQDAINKIKKLLKHETVKIPDKEKIKELITKSETARATYFENKAEEFEKRIKSLEDKTEILEDSVEDIQRWRHS